MKISVELRRADLPSESFKYNTVKQALTAVARLQKSATKHTAKDRIEREIVLIVRPEPSWELKRLFMAEIDNEADGGASPATLDSVLESLQGGYTPYDGFPVETVYDELECLIDTGDGGAPVADLLSPADWRQRTKL